LATLGDARTVLYNHGTALTTKCSELEQAYQEERQNRLDVARAYADLFNRLQGATNDNQVMAYKCFELQQQLKNLQEARDANSPMIQEEGQFSEAEITRVTGRDRELRGVAKQVIENEQLTARIRQPEQENVGTSRDHEKEPTSIADHTPTITQNVDELEKICQPTSAEQIPASVSVKAENADKGGSGSQQRYGQVKRARRTKRAAKAEERDNPEIAA
jgi:hypothetical protein